MVSNPRGSLWNKWDLHIHTPFSIEQHYGDSKSDDVWNQFFEDIESFPPEIKVLGINDYIFVDGYEKVLKAWKSGRLSNIDRIFPVIELRIERFAGTSSDFKRINYHVIFSDDVSSEVIRSQFIGALSAEYKLSPEYESLKGSWNGVVTTRESLIEFGKWLFDHTPEDKHQSLPSLLELGFMNLNYPLEEVKKRLDHHNFRDKYLTAVGKTEWSKMRWEGGGVASKKTIINDADLVFTAAKTVEDAHRSIENLQQQQVNCRLLDCSDAHYLSSSAEHIRLGHCFTWIKADTTFQGLKLAIRRYEDRVCITNEPEKLALVRNNKTKYIKSIEIRKSSQASLNENWFDCKLDFNHDLVAVIGNKGNGKSALTDIIALCGNTKVGDFSFLNTNRFCDRQKKAENFEAKLEWESGTSTSKKLSDQGVQYENESVKYVPQSFFEKVTNEVAVHPGSDFDKELKKVIFSHIPESDRLGFENLNVLLEHHMSVVQTSLSDLRRKLCSINVEIFRLEDETSEKQVRQTIAEIEAKKRELEAHDIAKPQPIEKPEEQSIQAKHLEGCRTEIEELRQRIEEKQGQFTSLKKRYSVVQQVSSTLGQLVEKVQHSLQDTAERLRQENIDDVDLNSVVKIEFYPSILQEYEARFLSEIGCFDQELSPQGSNSLVDKLQTKEEEASQLQNALNVVDGLHQSYLGNKQEWEVRREEILGSSEAVDSLTYLEKKLRRQQEDSPRKLGELTKQRQELTQDIYRQLAQLKQIYENLANPVQSSISQHYLTREKYGLDFKVSLVCSNFVDKFLDFINQGRTGSFMGKESGKEKLLEICRRYDFHLEEDVAAFVEEVLDHLKQDRRCNPPTPVEISTQLKQTVSTPEKVYDFLFSLEYLQPEYSLQLDGKEMKQLSPGERGVLLLIFYLLVDKEDCPLLIDQPEENLDNQSVYNLLVPAIKEAKKRRQIFLVTHNPNLAVVCDAEQIIHACMDKNDGNRVNYQSGAIENSTFNKLALDILEGTQPAFDIRRGTYTFHS